jgi:hypothetical protein
MVIALLLPIPYVNFTKTVGNFAVVFFITRLAGAFIAA